MVRACNHLGCTEFDDDPMAGVTESDVDVDVPPTPKDVEVVKKRVDVFPDRDVVTGTAVEGATYYEVYRAEDRLTTVSAPLTISSHTDLGRSFDLSFGSYYEVRACNKAGCSPLNAVEPPTAESANRYALAHHAFTVDTTIFEMWLGSLSKHTGLAIPVL